MEKYINKIIHGDCVEAMQDIPSDSIDVTFADPPLVEFTKCRQASCTRLSRHENAGSWAPSIQIL